MDKTLLEYLPRYLSRYIGTFMMMMFPSSRDHHFIGYVGRGLATSVDKSSCWVIHSGKTKMIYPPAGKYHITRIVRNN